MFSTSVCSSFKRFRSPRKAYTMTKSGYASMVGITATKMHLIDDKL